MPKAKDKVKHFRNEWLKDPKLMLWLEKIDKNNTICKCVPCNKILKCGHSELIKHSQSNNHCENMNKVSNLRSRQDKIDTMLDSFTQEKRKLEEHQRKVKSLELSLAAFFAEHNVAINVVDHLIELLKNRIDDSKIVKELQMKRTKCTAVIRNVLAKTERNNLVDELRQVKFSVLLDETTDITTTKQLCIVVRYINKNGKVTSRLLELVELDATDLSSVKIYEKFEEVFDKYKIPLSNLTGVASDGASVMVGRQNSFITHLKKKYPHVILLKCICHSANLVASKATAKIPQAVENLLRQIYSYVSGSAKRCAQLQEIQNYFNVQHYKILRLCGTRWLATYQCVERVLVNWEPLLSFFRVAVFEDGLDAASIILNLMESVEIKAYLLFLKYALDYMNKFNALFQSEQILINVLSLRSRQLLQQVGQNFLKSDVFKTDKPVNNNVLRPANYRELFEMYVGSECEIYMKSKLTSQQQHQVRIKILDFYICMFQEILDRLPIEGLFSYFEFLSPENAFRKDKIRFQSIPDTFNEFEGLNISKINDEWRNMPFVLNEREMEELSSQPLDVMWKNIGTYKDFTGTLVFQNIAELARIILTLPHSNAECERVFSVVNDVKTKKRNKLGDNTLNSICIIRSGFKSANICCTSFVPSEKHFTLFTKDIYES